MCGIVEHISKIQSAVANLTREYKVYAGVMISASHNPVEYNGIKFWGGEVYKLSDSLEDEIQLTDALLKLIEYEAMYAYDFEWRRYDGGDKSGFLQATVEYALRKEELRDGFIEYLSNILK